MLRLRDTMDRRFAEPLDLEALADTVGFSVSHTIRCFTSTFGETTHQYLYRRRIERAQWLLRTTERRMSDIAHAVGYDSVATFNRTVRRLVVETTHRPREPSR